MSQSSIKQAPLVVIMAASLILIWFLEISLSGKYFEIRGSSAKELLMI
jgi:hypothetical protein